MAEADTMRQPGGWLMRMAGLALAGLLAACAGVVPRAAPPPAAPPPVVEVKPQGDLPVDERHRVALLVPLTGTNAAVGQSIANAATLAMTDTGTKAIRITTYDTGIGAGAAATKALADGNVLILGPLLAEDVRAVAPAARGAGVPVIAFSNDAAVAGDGVYLLGFSPSQSIERVVRYARSRGIKRFAGLVPQGQYGRNASATLIRAAEAGGGSVVAMQGYQRTPKSLGNAVAALGKTGAPEAVMVADSGRVAVQAATLVRKVDAARLLGTELWNAEPGLWTLPAMAGAWYAAVPSAMYQQLAQRYRARYGRAPFRLASLGYDAVLLTVRVGMQWPVGDRFPVGRLADDAGFSGVDGAFRFGRDGIADRMLEVRQLGPKGATVVSPAAGSFRD